MIMSVFSNAIFRLSTFSLASSWYYANIVLHHNHFLYSISNYHIFVCYTTTVFKLICYWLVATHIRNFSKYYYIFWIPPGLNKSIHLSFSSLLPFLHICRLLHICFTFLISVFSTCVTSCTHEERCTVANTDDVPAEFKKHIIFYPLTEHHFD